MQLVIDVGTSNVRVCAIDDLATIVHELRRPFPPESPSPGLVEFDATRLLRIIDELLAEMAALTSSGPHRTTSWGAVGITNQRASTVVWDRATGLPIGPALGWQDLRTLGTCLALQSDGFSIPPNATATKAAALLDSVDGGRERDLCVGTVDSWLAWHLTGGTAAPASAVHVTDASNAAATGMSRVSSSGGVEWDPAVLSALNVPMSMLPTIMDSCGAIGPAIGVHGQPMLAAIIGDQQASLIGQGCVFRGDAKATFGTGGMLDVITGELPPGATARGASGTIPIAVRRDRGRVTWGVEAIMLSAGTAIDWLCDGLEIISSAAESEVVARACESTGDVWFVPSLIGMATPAWDYGARGTLVGVTRGTGRAEIVRAVLNGVAHRGADLLDAAEDDSGIRTDVIRVDGGMSDNALFTQLLSDATGRRVEISPEREATALGAGLLAGLSVGVWDTIEDLRSVWKPARVHEPSGHSERDRWAEAVQRSREWIPSLSALTF